MISDRSLESERLATQLKRIRPHNHACLIYETAEEQHATIVPFINDGFERGEKCMCITEQKTTAALLDSMQVGKIDVDTAISAHRLSITDSRQTFLKNGRFDPDSMIHFLAETSENARQSGFPSFRFVGEMNWSLGGDPGANRVMAYESKLNPFLRDHGILAICQYNQSLFPPETILEVIRNHPVVIFRNLVCENPYYVPQEAVLEHAGAAHEVVRMVTYLHERERAMEMLKMSEESFRLLAEGVSDHAIFMINPDGQVSSWSSGAERVLGYKAGEVLGQRYSQFYSAEDIAEGKPGEELRRALANRKVENDGWCLRKDGTRFWASVIIAAVRDKEGSLIGFSNVTRDLTERRALEEKFHHARRMEAVGRLAAGVAHDFNNLLSVIIGSSDLLDDQARDYPALRRHTDQIRKAGENAAKLTRQLLAFSRKQVLDPRVLDLNGVVSDLDKMLRRLISEDVELVTIAAPDLGQVKADPGQLEQVILNLVANARDAMPKGGKVVIETANVILDEAYARLHVPVVPGHYVMIAVSDNGAGMDTNTLGQVFEPFFTTKERATGLGLATVYGIVNQSGGHIWAYSEPGRGTTFKIYLPRVDAVVEAPSTVHVPQGEFPGGSETILLVEDSNPLRELAREFLEKGGYKVLEAPDGIEAAHIAQSFEAPIDLLLTDVVMPGMSGHDLAKRLELSHPEAAVLYVSGYTDDAIVHHGVLDEGIALLPKPFTRDSLMRKVREQLDANRAVTRV